VRGAKHWTVYIVQCADGTLYTGVTIDVTRRVAEHNGVRANGVRAVREIGARYTRTRRPVKLAYQERATNRSAACKREYAIKQMSRREKLALTVAASRIIPRAKKK
jgi:putative endonuclease